MTRIIQDSDPPIDPAVKMRASDVGVKNLIIILLLLRNHSRKKEPGLCWLLLLSFLNNKFNLVEMPRIELGCNRS